MKLMSLMSSGRRQGFVGAASWRIRDDMPRNAIAIAIAIAVAFSTVVTGCCPAARPDLLPDSAYPGELRNPADLGKDVVWRQKVTAKWGKSQERSFEAVLQKQGGKLTLLGLSPMGQMGFAITLSDGELTFENKSGRELPFPPRFILLDVQRVFWPWIGSPPADGEGTREGTVPGEQVRETWSGGRLVERTFERTSDADDEPKGTIRVSYSGWKPGLSAPAKAVLNNGWFKYVLVVETYEQDSLGGAAK